MTDNPKLKIGEYAISEYSAGGFWIAHDSGEGMQVSEKVLEELIRNFWKVQF